MRPIEIVLEEIDRYQERFKHPYIFFVDNDPTLDSSYSRTLFGRILERRGRRFSPFLFANQRLSTDDELLGILEQFNRTTIAVEFKSLADDSLASLHKGQSTDDIMNALDRFRRYRVNVQALFIFGGDFDTVETIRSPAETCIRNKFYSIGMCALYDFPTRERVLGQPQLIPDHQFIHRDWRFFSGYFAVQFPKRMRPSRLQQGILDGMNRFFDRSSHTVYQFMPIRRTVERYIDYLRSVEQPFYDGGDNRIEERLSGRSYSELTRHVPIHVPQAAIYVESGRFFVHNLLRTATWKFVYEMLLSKRPGSKQARRLHRGVSL